MNLARLAFVVLLLTFGGASGELARAESLTVSATFGGDSIPGGTGGVTTQFSLPKFDPELGELVNVAYSFTLDLSVNDVSVENRLASPTTNSVLSMFLVGQVVGLLPSGSFQVTGPAYSSPFNLGPSDGRNFSGVDYLELGNLSNEIARDGFFTSGSDSYFIGPGTFQIESLQTFSIFNPALDFAIDFHNYTAISQLSLTYIYEVPEPTSLSLALVASLALYTVRRGSRRIR